jgi:hypothetical protein
MTLENMQELAQSRIDRIGCHGSNRSTRHFGRAYEVLSPLVIIGMLCTGPIEQA